MKRKSEKRLIDANVLKSFLCKCCNILRPDEPCEPSDCNVLAVIDEQPTVDVVEVVHAYWKGDEPGDWHCSNCGEYAAEKNVIMQKVSRSEKSICGKCSHRFVCRALDNQPCFECNQFSEEVVRCKACKWRRDDAHCPMCFEEEIEWDDDGYTEVDWILHDHTIDDGFCDRGERRTDDIM